MMRYVASSIILLLLAACNSVAPISPTPGSTVAAQNTSPEAVGQPTAVPSPPRPFSTPVPSQAPFDAALRPEVQGDLSLVHSPTIYEMDLQLDPGLARLTGHETVTYTNRTPAALSEIYFRLFANYPDGGDKISVSNTRVEGQAVLPALESQDTALRVPLSQPLAVGSRVTLDLDFGVTIPMSNTVHYADFTNSEGIVTLPSIYPLIPAHDAQGWHTELPPPYGDLVYADTSLYDVHITAPTTTTIIASGLPVDQSQQGDETTWRYIGAPMRDFDLDASALLRQVSAQVGDITINSYYLPQDEAAGRDVLTWASDALAVYQKRVGPYPFKTLDVVETPTQAGGIEYPGLVVIASELYRNNGQRKFFEFAVAHEVAHQWFYAQVGDDQVNSPWMDESIVQYLSLIYEEDVYGERVASSLRQSVFQSPYDRARLHSQDKPVGLPVAAYSEEQYGEIVYGKGPLFFDAVRNQVGDSRFFQFLQTYYERYKYQVAMPDDLRRTMDEVTGQNIDALYNQWILGK